MHQSNIILSKGYGLAKINEGTKINNQTNFRLASITKQFTAMAIMILKQRGQLNYEQTLTEFFDGFPTYGSSITVRHLMNHTSGLIDYFSLIPDTTTEQLKDLDVLELMRLLLILFQEANIVIVILVMPYSRLLLKLFPG